MKSLLTIIALMISTQALAVDITKTNLNLIDLDPKLNLPNTNSASITVNEKANTVTLTLVHEIVCPPHAECLIGGEFPMNIELPIVSINVDRCSVPHILAKRDLRLTDGDLEQIEVTDNSKTKCLMVPHNTLYKFPAPTVVDYTTDGFDHINHSGSIQTHSHFEGPALQ